MELFASKSAPCKDNTDGTILVKMKLQKYIDKLDCVAMDGGYTQSIKKVINGIELESLNFCLPIRKQKGI